MDLKLQGSLFERERGSGATTASGKVSFVRPGRHITFGKTDCSGATTASGYSDYIAFGGHHGLGLSSDISRTEGFSPVEADQTHEKFEHR